MSILRVANIQFNAAGTKRIDYDTTADDGIIRVTADAIKIPVGDTASRPNSQAGMIRYNSDTGYVEFGGSGNWLPVASNAAFITANSAYASINSNWTVTNTVYGVANTALQNTTGTFAGSLTISGGSVNLDNSKFITNKDDAGTSRSVLGTASDGTVYLYGYHSSQMIVGVNGITYVYPSSGGSTTLSQALCVASGGVGIGTYSPITKFDVIGDISTHPMSICGNSNPYFFFTAADAVTNGNTDVTLQTYSGTSRGPYWSNLNFNTSGTIFKVYNTEAARISVNRNLLIGTTNETGRVTINPGSAQFPTCIYVEPSTHASSRRSSISLDGWVVAQDTGGSGTKDFGIYSVAGSAWRMMIDTSGNLQFNSGYGSTTTAYGCRAWVNFNGTTASPSTIRGSGNVSSVTKNGTGDYTVNFSTSMPDTNYGVSGSCGREGSRSDNLNTTSIAADVFNTGSVRILSVYEYSPVKRDSLFMSIMVYR